uniref:BED-type domain-containing protein n=1 Tax=Gasterosteus aculeatus aculeatus TaxID=481459 RepID=A0AAQ4R083_GASAC
MEGESSATPCTGPKLVAHPRAKSKVWKYFGFDTDANGFILRWKRIYCRVCMSQIAYSGNTSNLSYHLEKNHPLEFNEFVKSNTDQMREAFATAIPRIKKEPSGLHSKPPSQDPNSRQGSESDNRRHSDLTVAVITFICEGLYPVSLVEEPTFRSLMSTVDPGYSLPSQREVAVKMLPQMYCRTRDMVFSELVGVVNCGVSTDLWHCQTQNRTYISLSMHSVNYDCTIGFSMINRCLKTFEVQGDNTAKNITRAMHEAFVEWGITHKVTGATTNGSVDVVKACSLLELSVEMPCLGHAINRAVDEAFQLPQVDSFFACCRKLVDHFKEPTLYLLKEKQKQHGLTQCALITDRTRSWLATLAMLERLKEQQIAITATLRESSSSHNFTFDGPQWSLLDGLIKVLQPFKVVTNMITHCSYPTISMVRPLLHMLLDTTLKVKEGDLKDISKTKEVISKVLSTTYSRNTQLSQEISTFLNIATFLDPRYKKLPFLSLHEHSKVESNIIEECKAILEKQIAEQPCLDDYSWVCDEPPNKKPAPLRKHTGSSIQDNPLAAIFCQSDTEQNQEELHAQVLQKYWCVPATSVPCHRMFNSSGTALFVLPRQNGRVAVVTGGTRGMGYETARHLASLGMHVVIAGNEREEGAAAVRTFQEEGVEGKVEFVFLDLTSLKSVRQFAQAFADRGLPLHVLVNNAGTMMVPERQTEDGFEFHFTLNYLGHFLLTNLLLDTLKRSGRPGRCSRIINMSSATHFAGVVDMEDLNKRICYSSHAAYSQSKLALVLFTYYLQEQLAAGGFPVTVNAVDPGMVDTALYDNLWSLAQAMKKPVAKTLFRTPAEGASISIYAAASSELEGVGACYLYNSHRIQSSDSSYDSELQAELWKKSCELVGIRDSCTSYQSTA